jgi:hypothetical protein
MGTRSDRGAERSVGGFAGLACVCVLGAACAASPRPRPEPRVKDSVPDKIAAQRAASGELHLEDDDERWGIEAERANRKSDSDQQGQASPTVPPPAGPVDLKGRTPGSPPPP